MALLRFVWGCVLGLVIFLLTGKTQRWITRTFWMLTELQLEEIVDIEGTDFRLIAYGSYVEVFQGKYSFALNDSKYGITCSVNRPKGYMPYTEVYRSKVRLKEVQWIRLLKRLNRVLVSSNAYQQRYRELQEQRSKEQSQGMG